MTTKEFIEAAIGGGYKEDEISKCTIWLVHDNALNGKKDCLCIDFSYDDHITGERVKKDNHYPLEFILLDPMSWQAVAKVKGWNEDGKGTYFSDCSAAELMHHRLITALHHGKSIEDYLKTL